MDWHCKFLLHLVDQDGTMHIIISLISLDLFAWCTCIKHVHHPLDRLNLWRWNKQGFIFLSQFLDDKLHTAVEALYDTDRSIFPADIETHEYSWKQVFYLSAIPKNT
jgi:hypothetical protein